MVLFPSVDDTLEVSAFQRSTTNQTTIDIWFSEQLWCIASFA
jgi:hypothetical protein